MFIQRAESDQEAREMDERIKISFNRLYAILREQPKDHHTGLMEAALESLEQLLRASRYDTSHSRRLIELLCRDGGSLMHGRNEFIDVLGELQSDLHNSFPTKLGSLTQRPHVYFLSYARNDKAAADCIDHLLQESGCLVWRDIRGLAPGDDHLEIIAANVDLCSCFIALYNKTYVGSDYCKGEMDRAMKRLRKGPTPCRVVLLRLDETDIPLNFGTRTWVWARTTEELKLAVQRLLQNEPNCLKT